MNYHTIWSISIHLSEPLNEGTNEGYNVEYPWHGSKFDVRTGKPTKPPTRQPIPSYEVKVEGTIYNFENINDYEYSKHW